ncbi:MULTISPECIES: YdeI/OmpD-associated family protein [unclassified Fusibacter]|uniref:YdeI/OmpD-associated family protein n=1 Tax=unclassified Fusibacter TaxID=2624464 RepID=UPI0010130C7D|nr:MULTISPECIES: YdeI/OmpD-associated family protein [unclassified Fusibacter]MCK8058444.1 YdeI/OmpD-associated family protein [Fusibacter sp. A2]NPE22788.1 YdeI/OmpD-associated family protein [Fusibacter sp. A1]RXV60344.1 hypothetical protein DWB64_13150 [Fusibacter sp. A1]
MKSKLSSGVLHDLPDDMIRALCGTDELIRLWEGLTPLARNEWICWVISVKKSETRQKHLNRLLEDLLSGKKRPCCWPGCPHR